MGIIEKISKLQDRKNPEICTKVVKDNNGSNAVSGNIIEKYNYYVCDYCGQEIKILDKKQEMDGGTMQVSALLTGNISPKLALHNRCLKPMIKDIEQERKWKN